MADDKKVQRKSMPKITITIDEEFRLPEEDELHPRFPMEDEDWIGKAFEAADFPFPDSPLRSGAKAAGKAAKRALGKSKRAQRLEDEKNKKDED
jgi:hypothetical protein